MTAALVSALHVLSIALGLAAVFLRGRAMREPFTAERRGELFATDSAWGVAGLLLLGTGLFRWLGGLDKPADFYLRSRAFHLKLGLVAALLLLEVWPMITFIGFRIALARGEVIDPSRLAAFRVINRVELGLMVVIVFVAAAMARGIGFR